VELQPAIIAKQTNPAANRRMKCSSKREYIQAKSIITDGAARGQVDELCRELPTDPGIPCRRNAESSA
jgi:hypothetical protein